MTTEIEKIIPSKEEFHGMISTRDCNKQTKTDQINKSTIKNKQTNNNNTHPTQKQEYRTKETKRKERIFYCKQRCQSSEVSPLNRKSFSLKTLAPPNLKAKCIVSLRKYKLTPSLGNQYV